MGGQAGKIATNLGNLKFPDILIFTLTTSFQNQNWNFPVFLNILRFKSKIGPPVKSF